MRLRKLPTLKPALIALLLTLPWAAAVSVPAMYERALANVLVHEGYTYENVPGDPGGPTKYGITIYDVRHYLKPGATAADVRRLTLDQAKEIYRKHYWNEVGGDELPAGLDYSVFDYAVNAGMGRALPTLHLCRAVSEDTEAQIRCVNDRRMAFQMGLPSHFNKFKRGWANRIRSVKTISLNMAGVSKANLPWDLFGIPRIGRGKAFTEEPR